MVEGAILAVLTCSSGLMLGMLRAQTKRIRSLEVKLDKALRDYYAERSTAGTARQSLAAIQDDVDDCVAGCEHRPRCPVVAEHDERALRRMNAT